MPDFQKFLDGAGKALETVPDLYEDGLKETVQETGKVLALLPKTIRALLAGPAMWVDNRIYNIEATAKLLDEKLKNISPDKLVAPAAYVAVPALQAIAYSMDSDELRNMYANLLAKSMVADTKDNVHPAFVEIIKQMSPLDAKVYKLFVEALTLPIISLKGKSKNTPGNTPIINNFTGIALDIAPFMDICKTIDNLSRCGLINIAESRAYTDKNNYDIIRNSNQFIAVKNSLINAFKDTQDIIEQEGMIFITDLGRAFYTVCIKDILV